MSLIEQQLTPSERQEIESRLAHYNIPYQILEMVAERCECTMIGKIGKKDSGKRSKLSVQLASLNDKSIVLLQQIFLDCHDSFSNFRFAVFLSSRYSPTSHKFVMNEKTKQKAEDFDIYIYRRDTEELVAVGMHNADPGQMSDTKSIKKFLEIIKSLRAEHPNITGAYYASSSGYKDINPSNLVKTRKQADEKLEIKFFEYKDRVYFENKSVSS